ncbi:hypothetical protein DICA1_A04610 [Diutina catenulata]
MSPTYTVHLRNHQRTFSAKSTHKENEVYATQPFDRIIFLLHGFPDNNDTYDLIWDQLVSAFPRALVLAPAMRGYEKSSQGPDGEYRVSDLASDVKAWVHGINAPVAVPVHLVGHDWGAITCFKVAQLYPELVRSMVTLAIPYIANAHVWDLLWHCPEQIWYSSYFLTMQIRSIYAPKFKGKYLDELWNYWSPTWRYPQRAIDSVRATLASPGVLDASTAYYRCLLNPLNLLQLKWRVDFNKVPTLIVGGETDGCMSKRLLRLEQRWLNGTCDGKVEVVEVPKAGHFLQQEAPDEVAKLAIDWFKKFA